MQKAQTIDVYKMNTVGERVKQERKSKGLSQLELAECIGTTQTTIGNLEQGRNKSSKWIFKIAEQLNVSPSWLQTGGGLKTTLTSAFANAHTPESFINKENSTYQYPIFPNADGTQPNHIHSIYIVAQDDYCQPPNMPIKQGMHVLVSTSATEFINDKILLIKSANFPEPMFRYAQTVAGKKELITTGELKEDRLNFEYDAQQNDIEILGTAIYTVNAG